MTYSVRYHNVQLFILIFLYFIECRCGQPPIPEWPKTYKACLRMETSRQFITVGYYVDTDNQRMRLDSYGIPKEDKFAYTEGVKSFEYACPQIGAPLYVFIYHYIHGKELDIFPIPNPPYKHCTVQNISNTFPPSPILENLLFIERTHDNITVYDHWRSEYFLFTIDYFFHANNGLPYKLFVNAEEHQFLSMEVGDLDDDVFLPPEGVSCYYRD